MPGDGGASSRLAMKCSSERRSSADNSSVCPQAGLSHTTAGFPSPPRTSTVGRSQARHRRTFISGNRSSHGSGPPEPGRHT